LGDEVAEVGAETHVGDGGLVVAPFLDREAFEEEETLSVEDIVTKVVEEITQLGKRELCLYRNVSECVEVRPSTIGEKSLPL